MASQESLERSSKGQIAFDLKRGQLDLLEFAAEEVHSPLENVGMGLLGSMISASRQLRTLSYQDRRR